MNLAAIRDIFVKTLEELQLILKNASPNISIKNYNDLKDYCSICDLKKLLVGFQAMQEMAADANVNEEHLKEKFALLMNERREITKQTFLCPLADPHLVNNALCIKLFDQLYPEASITTYLSVFALDVKKVLLLDLNMELSEGKKLSAKDYRVSHTVLPIQDAALIKSNSSKYTKQFIIENDTALPFVSTLIGNFTIFSQIYTLLLKNYRDFYHQLKKYQNKFRSIYEKIEEIENKGLTLAERIERLKHALILAGTKITGKKDAHWRVTEPILTFHDYLHSLPEEIKKEVLAIATTDSGVTLDHVMTQLATNPNQCVETAAGWLQCILNNPKNKNQLEKTFLFENRKVYEKYIDALGKDKENLNRIDCLNLPESFVQTASIQIDNSNDIGLLLQNFDAQFYSLFTEKINIKDINDFKQILVFLDETQSRAFCSIFKDQLKPVLHKEKTYKIRELFEKLTVQRTAVYEALIKDDIQLIINDAIDFYHVVQYLIPEQRTAVYEAFKEKLPQIITNRNDLVHVLNPLTLDQCSAVFQAIKEKFPQIITHRCDFRFVLRELTPVKYMAFYEAFKEKLPQIITDGNGLVDVLGPLTHKQCTAFCQAIKEKLQQIITNINDLVDVLRLLNPEKCTAVCQALKENLPQIITNSNDLVDVLRPLNPEKCTAVCQALKGNLPQIITNSNDLVDVLRPLTHEQCAAVCQAMKENLPQIITNSNDLADVLRPLTHEQCAAVCQAIKEKLPQIITNGYDYYNLVEYHLTPEKRTVVYKAFREKLPQIIKTSDVNYKQYYFFKERQFEGTKKFYEECEEYAKRNLASFSVKK